MFEQGYNVSVGRAFGYPRCRSVSRNRSALRSRMTVQGRSGLGVEVESRLDCKEGDVAFVPPEEKKWHRGKSRPGNCC